MEPRLALPGASTIALVLAIVVFLAAGCGHPAHHGKEFVGTWAMAQGTDKEPVLDLRSDGLGTSRLSNYPHEEAVRWAIVGDTLVVTAINGTSVKRLGFRFDKPDRLVIIMDKAELALQRVSEPKEASPS